MKTISISDDLYRRLKDLSNEIKTQDNRATAKPYFYQIQCEKEVISTEGNGECIYINENGEGELREDKEIIEFLSGYFYENEDEMSKHIELEDDSDEHIALKALELATQLVDSNDYASKLEEIGYREIWVTKEHEYKNAFLTEKSIKEHIKLNHYHYNKPTDYLNYAFRNPDMELVFELLESL